MEYSVCVKVKPTVSGREVEAVVKEVDRDTPSVTFFAQCQVGRVNSTITALISKAFEDLLLKDKLQ